MASCRWFEAALCVDRFCGVAHRRPVLHPSVAVCARVCDGCLAACKTAALSVLLRSVCIVRRLQVHTTWGTIFGLPYQHEAVCA